MVETLLGLQLKKIQDDNILCNTNFSCHTRKEYFTFVENYDAPALHFATISVSNAALDTDTLPTHIYGLRIIKAQK
ncbi:hypothetical protein BDA96_03G031900 [Sorghum bicolor]|uniref:Uncharacterized protein n=2 Tax=Sorghum bicolor TaxID=4558 RepID=A0A921RAB1_SORBI|nr:hypothetical protein BDA96_03G031900 [Sorghum bicolor]OQU86144.1 hypothetical protein SORBI_3003G029150 [Sorghum bicolor]